MKTTGIIRRIDDLGRIVIPKEIRKNLRIKREENLEIFVSDEKIILKKFNQLDKLKDITEEIVTAISSITKKSTLITNLEQVQAAAGPKAKEYINQNLEEKIVTDIINRKEIYIENKTNIKIIQNKEENISYIQLPIIANGDIIGSIIIISEIELLTKKDFETLKIMTTFLQNYIEG